MKRTFVFLSLSIPVALAAGALVLLAQVQNPAGHDQEPVGYTDTPVIPGQKWRVHDIDRPRPRHVTPGAQYGIPPSDAIVLFDGKNLSKWNEVGKRENAGKLITPTWKVENGFFEVCRARATWRQRKSSATFSFIWSGLLRPLSRARVRIAGTAVCS